MFSVFQQTNTFTSFDYLPGIGQVVTTKRYGRTFFCRFGIWYEIIAPWHPRGSPYQQYTNLYKEAPHARYIMAESQRDKEAREEQKAKEDAEWLKQMKEEAGWVEGYVYVEEEEPDFWTFFKQLSKDTEERIRQTLEMEENYMIARFDFH